MADLRIADAPEIDESEVQGGLKIPTGGFGNKAINMNTVASWVVKDKDLPSKDYVDTAVAQGNQGLAGHVANKNNPHEVTKEQVGLGDVDNTADADKPVSNATSAALNLKADKNQLDGKADKIAVHSKSATLPTYYTKEAGVNSVTGVANGAYFNARSNDDATMLVEYQNIGGVATPTGKSYPSSNMVLGLKDDVEHLKKVVTVDIRDFGAKCDNYTDDSAAIQAAIDFVAEQGGGEVHCSGKILSNQTLVIKDKVSLVAPWIGRVSYNVYAAAIIRKTTPGPFFAHEETSLAWGLRNLLMIGSNVVSIGFDITKAAHCNVDNCMFADCVNIGWNFVSRTGPITFCEFTRLGNKGGRIGAVIDYDSSVDGTYNNGNRYGFSIFLRHTEIGVWYKHGGSNTLESYGGEVASVEPDTISLRYDNGVAQMMGDWWAEPKYGNPIVVNGGVLTIVGNGRLLGEVIENGGIILWDQPVGVWQYPVYPSVQRTGVKHAYSFREGSLRDAMGNKDLTQAGTISVNPDSSRYGSMMQLNGAGSYMYLDSTDIDWSQDWTIAICAKAVGNESAIAGVVLRIQKGVSDASQYLSFNGIPANRFFTVGHYVDSVLQKTAATPVTSTWGRVYQWAFIKYDSVTKKIYGSRGMEGEGDSFWLDSGLDLDLSTFLSNNSRVVLGQANNNRTFRIDELLVMQRQITPKEMMAINASALDLEAIFGTTPVVTTNPSTSITYDPPSIPSGETHTTTVTLTGVVVGDIVQAAFSRYNADIEISATVSASNTVTVKFKNTGAAPIDLTSGTLTVKKL